MDRAQVLKCRGRKSVLEISSISVKECSVLDMGYKNIRLIVEGKGTAQCKLNMLNVMESEEIQHEQGPALFVVFSISQNLEVEFPPDFFYWEIKNPNLPILQMQKEPYAPIISKWGKSNLKKNLRKYLNASIPLLL